MSKKAAFLVLASEQFGVQGEFTNKEMLAYAEGLDGFVKADWNWVFNKEYKIGHAKYRLPALAPESKRGRKPATEATPAEEVEVDTKVLMAPLGVAKISPAPQAKEVPVLKAKFDPNAVSTYNHAEVPAKDPLFVPFGEFRDVMEVVKSGKFFPLFISGLSGNGKTFMVEQACARARRPMVRVQISPETDEDDLIGGFRLVEGQTKFLKGPVLRAMEEGALLLIDEADRANPGKIMCLQGVLEGKPYYVKKTGEIITPAPGFNIIVTANTKGRGSDDGRYVAAAVLDDAWLERFPVTIAQQYPTKAVEKRILTAVFDEAKALTDENKQFIEVLTTWSEMIRKTFEENGADELISTRRLVHIVRTFMIFNDRARAIDLCTNRFDEMTKTSFKDLYSKLDATPAAGATQAPAEVGESASKDPDMPF